jgi:hypothetical protein
LELLEMAGAWQACLEALLVVEDGARALASRELVEGICLQGRAETQVEELGEAPLGRCAFVVLDLDVPELCCIF